MIVFDTSALGSMIFSEKYGELVEEFIRNEDKILT